MLRTLLDVVQVTADNTDVFSTARIGGTPPPWARAMRVQLVAPDTDWTWSVSLGGVELARDSGPSTTAADNTQDIDFRKAHIYSAIGGSGNFDVRVNVNVVTSGVGICGVLYEG